MFSEIKCSERCLLYSMRMLGNDVESLLVASGTIFNEIIVWKLICSNPDDFLLPCRNYKDSVLSRLIGHEGSIFRIAWFSNGLKLVSVSDDRSARIWEIHDYKGVSNGVKVPVLFGHNARIWDCAVFDSFIITAGEDCTCRVWDHDGTELNRIKEHIGRGVWRCLYDPNSSLLVTAGFDSAIKVHQILNSELSETEEEVFAISIPNSSGKGGGLMDSKSEYVRCLHLSREDSLYVGTNNGSLYHTRLFTDGSVEWTELFRISHEAPIICMNVLSENHFGDWIAVGDGEGSMTIVLVDTSVGNPKLELTLTWSAEKERHLLGTYWCTNRFVFTADPGGRLKLWRVTSDDCCLMAEFISSLGMRIMCVDASLDQEVLVCGDIRGNLLLYSFPRSLMLGKFIAEEVKSYSPLISFKGAHGVSSVCSVLVNVIGSEKVEIRSTGADGCICSLRHDKNLLHLEFLGMKQVKELSAIRDVYSTPKQHSDYAIGFASANFIVWNLTAETKVMQVACGGWRRPHSYYLGDVPERNKCFAYVKDDVIYIHRLWVPENDMTIYPQNLHCQFHGREIHCLCFVPSYDENQESSWIATGCEDGTVRLTMYDHGTKSWSISKNLGEHVGGSAVRSVISVSNLYLFMGDSNHEENREENPPLILISVGAKRVITAWKQMSNQSCSLSFQWLSSDMPFKYKKTRELGKIENNTDNDWRYLDVTAFLVKDDPDSRISVCFVVVACSDATVTLRALVIPFQIWFDVASLSPLSSPVLALKHVVIPKILPSKGNIPLGYLYFAISGSTDGSISFWDLTECVEHFMRRISFLDMEKKTEFPKRPRTGRGSQGGRLWQSIEERHDNNAKNKTVGTNLEFGKVIFESKKDDSPTLVISASAVHSVHQSGVNCLHVSDIIMKEEHHSMLVSFYVISGGDDQAINCMRWELEINQTFQIQNHQIKFVQSSDKMISAHTASVKGVWTDGIWVFSTGVDQRVRCWKIDKDKLTECARLVVNVPEPEGIDVKAVGRNYYQIAVAGRGMQMVEFYP